MSKYQIDKIKIYSSNRLFYREWTENDAEFLFNLNSDPDVIRYTGDPPFKSVEHALELIKNYEDYKVHGIGRWLCCLKTTHEPIGWAGLKNQLETEGIIDIGYRFLKKYWKQGYGFESASASLKAGFEKYELEKITGRAAVDNIHSIKIIKKIRLKEEKEKRDCHGILAKYFSLTRDEYFDMTSQNKQ